MICKKKKNFYYIFDDMENIVEKKVYYNVFTLNILSFLACIVTIFLCMFFSSFFR